MIVIVQNTQEKADFQKTKVNATKARKVCAVNFVLGKNGSHMPSSLGGRLTVVIRKTGRQTKFLQFTK